MTIRIVDVTDEAGFGRSRRAPTRVRPSVVRLLGGRRPRLEGGPLAWLERSAPAPDAAARPVRGQPVPRRPRGARGREPVRPAIGTRPNPFLDDDDARRSRTRSRRAERRAGRRAGRAAQAPAARPRPRRRRQLREGPLTRRRPGGVLPVRAADRLSAGAADARPLPAAAGRAAARGHHLHRHDRRGARARASALPLVAGGLRRPRGARVRGRRDLPGGRRPPDATSAATPAFWEAAGFASRSPTSGSRSCGGSSA